MQSTMVFRVLHTTAMHIFRKQIWAPKVVAVSSASAVVGTAFYHVMQMTTCQAILFAN